MGWGLGECWLVVRYILLLCYDGLCMQPLAVSPAAVRYSDAILESCRKHAAAHGQSGFLAGQRCCPLSDLIGQFVPFALNFSRL